MNLKSTLLAALSVAFAASSAIAAPITGVSAVPASGNGSVSSVVITTTMPASATVPGAGTVDVTASNTNMDVLAADPIEIVFQTGMDPVSTFLPTIYQFNYTINNANRFGKEITGIDFFLSGASFVNNAIPGGNGSIAGGFHQISNGHIRFGGLTNGGGGQIANAASTTLSFQVAVPPSDLVGSPSSFTLGMVANPEPASLALGGMALMGFGGVVARRRRKKKQTEDAAV